MRFSTDEESGLAKVLSFLKSHDTEYLSGQDLSDVLRISRVAVWKHVRKIRQLGYAVESSQKLGYRLVSGTDALLPWEVTDGLDTKTIGRHIHYLEQTDSTQDMAIRMARGGAKEGTIIIARRQTGGRGRNGRRWASPEGGIHISVILRPKFELAAATLFPMAASVALSNAAKKSMGIRTELKWPNDITLNGRKVAGMLVDMSVESNRILDLVLGVGINYDIDVRGTARMLRGTPNFYGVASLATDKSPGPRMLLQAFLTELESTYDRMNRGSTQGIADEWTRLSSTIGKKVRINTGNGPVSGVAAGIDPDGALVMERNGKTSRVMYGDVVHA